jgi:hypothetical protein
LSRVREGAALFILDNADEEGGESNANGLLRLVGMEITRADTVGPARFYGIGDFGGADPAIREDLSAIPLTANADAVTGGEGLMEDAAGNHIFSLTRVGDGAIAVFTDPDLFYNLELGDVSANLTDRTRQLTRLEFQIMKLLAERKGESHAP